MRDIIAAERFYGTYRKKTVILLAALFILLGSLMVFPDILSVPKGAKTRKKIETVMEKFSSAYRNKDVQAVMALYSDSADAVALGTGKAGKCIGPEAIKKAYQREFAALENIQSVEFKTVSLFVSGEIAALAADTRVAEAQGGGAVVKRGTLTAVLKGTDGNWLFLQTHFSHPPEQLDAG